MTVGYVVSPACRDRGYATKAVRALVAWALGQPEAAGVRVPIPLGNAPSPADARTAGMRRVGLADDDVGEGEVWVILAGERSSG